MKTTNVNDRTTEVIEAAEKIEENDQLSVFFIEENKKLSNTIDIFDNIPFYVLKQPPTPQDLIDRFFTYKDISTGFNVEYKLVITPGTSIRQYKSGGNKGGKKIIKRFPNVSDELIEQVVRKLAAEGQCFVEGGHISVAFSIYQLFKELESLHLTRSYTEIFESIEILSSSQTDLLWTDDNGQQRSYKSSIFNNRRWISPKEAPINYKGKKDLYCVTFHPLVTKSIVDRTFRQFNYKRHMAIQDYCARWIHKRMCHNFTWANQNQIKPYHLSLSTIIQGSGIKQYSSIYDTIRRIENSISELSSIGIVDRDKSYTDKKRGLPRSTKICDAVFNLFPTEAFVKEQISSNHRFKQINGSSGKQLIEKRFGLKL